MKNAIVSPDLYDEQYYLTNNIGAENFREGLDKAEIHSKYRSVLDRCSFSADKAILDIGCGRGELVYYAARSGCEKAVGIDYSQAAINLANAFKGKLPKELQDKIHFYKMDALELSNQEKFDYIFFVEVWEHMYDHQLVPFLEKIPELMKDDGLFILTTPNAFYERYLYPAKRVINIPLNVFKFPLRMLRGKYRPKSFSDLVKHIFKVRPFGDHFLDQTHVNVSSPIKIERMLREKGLAAEIICSDSSRNPLSLFFSRWAGREMIITAKKVVV